MCCAHGVGMNRTRLDQTDFDVLLRVTQAGKASGLTHFTHLDQPIGIWNYIRIANSIAKTVPSGHVLDWGCGYGQMTYLLKRRGLQVTAFDIGESAATTLPCRYLAHDMKVVYSTHPTKLPFLEKSFDAVLSCGVLEHVDEGSEPGNESKSLLEIARVLRPGGHLLIYQLPQSYAWQEAIGRRLRLGYVHPRRYTAIEITAILQEAGFSVTSMSRANLIPKNLTGMPNRVRVAYSRFSSLLIALDGIVCKIPGLNNLAGALEVTARNGAV